ncbi:MAG: hypothetical protein LH606_15810 [Cytophagaceae bacterium]|nr:hypothetical protein [Cytophagaceae bacterium]
MKTPRNLSRTPDFSVHSSATERPAYLMPSRGGAGRENIVVHAMTKQIAAQFITADVARHGKVTPVGMQVFRESKMKFSDFAKATRRGLELFEAYQTR